LFKLDIDKVEITAQIVLMFLDIELQQVLPYKEKYIKIGIKVCFLKKLDVL